MANIGNVLKEEIQRLARRQVNAAVTPLKRENIRLKKGVAELRRQIAALDRTNRELIRKVTPVVAVTESEKAAEVAPTLRPTSKGLERLRHRLGLTQVQFGKLLGVSGQAVVNWATHDGRLRLRRSTLSALASIQQIGKREARRRLEAMGEPVARPRRRRRHQPTA